MKILKLEHYNIVKNQLQKIIPYGDNILMASYSDNKNAQYWKNILNYDKNTQIKFVQNKLDELNLNISKIDDIIIKYWNEGVHYVKPFGKFSFRVQY
jgi:hypothetical protein